MDGAVGMDADVIEPLAVPLSRLVARGLELSSATFGGLPRDVLLALPLSIWLICSLPVFSNLASSWPRLGFDFPARLCLEVDCRFVGMCASRSSFCSKKLTLELPLCCARGHDGCRPSEA